MRKRVALIILIPILGVLATPYLLNLYRVTQYEERVAHLLSLKPDNWHLPKQIPDSATKVFYDYSAGEEQETSFNTLRFRLSVDEAAALALELTKQFFDSEMSESPQPTIAQEDDYRTLVWSDSKGEIETQGGIWYSYQRQEFLFFHRHRQTDTSLPWIDQ